MRSLAPLVGIAMLAVVVWSAVPGATALPPPPGSSVPSADPTTPSQDNAVPADCDPLAFGIPKEQALACLNSKPKGWKPKAENWYPFNLSPEKPGEKVASAVVYTPLWDGIRGFCADLLSGLFTFWLRTPSVDLERSGGLKMWGVTLAVGEFIAILLLVWQSVRTMITRKGSHLIEGVQGLGYAALWTLGGVVLMQSTLTASDALTVWLLDAGSDAMKDRSVEIMAILGALGSQNPVAGILWGLVIALLGVAQLIVFFLWQASIPLMAVLLPIVAAGQVGGRDARQWLVRLWTTFAAAAAYKPMAAGIYAIGFAELGNGKGVLDIVRALTTLTMAIIALPVLQKVFHVFGLQAAQSGGLQNMLGMLGSANLLTAGGGSGGGGGQDGGGGRDSGGKPSPGADPALAAAQFAERLTDQATSSTTDQDGGQDAGHRDSQQEEDGGRADVPGTRNAPAGDNASDRPGPTPGWSGDGAPAGGTVPPPAGHDGLEINMRTPEGRHEGEQ